MDIKTYKLKTILKLLKQVITLEHYVRNVNTCNWETHVTPHSLFRHGGTSRVTIILVVLAFYTLSAHSQTIIPSGPVSGVWTPEASPYLVEGDINIPMDSTLSIEAGTYIEFRGYFGLTVYGWLYANGEVSDSIFITALDTIAGWSGIKFFNQIFPQNDSSLLNYCSLSYANNFNKSGRGGAIYCKNSTRLILDNLNIFKCEADSGAGIYLQNSPVSIRNSKIHNCFADRGGGIFLHTASPEVNNLIIENNTANVCGGLNFYKSNGSFNNLYIINNTSYGGGGGIVINRNCSPEFVNSVFQNNTANGSGGGVAIIQSSDPVFRYCTINGNQTVLDIYETLGGGIFITRFDNFPQFINCTINHNISSGNGGGMYTGDEVSILNCLISNNISNTQEGIGGGGIYSAEGSVLIMNTTLVENNGLKGKNIYSNGSTIAIYNSIIWNNTSILQNHVYLSGYILPSIFSCNYNDIQDGELSIDGEGTYTVNYGAGNLESDPLFESMIGEDYNLTENSPCIAKGTLDTLFLFIQQLDLNHNARIVHDSIDMGGYEHQGGVLIDCRMQNAECRVFPNPFRDVLNIQLETSEIKGSLSIISLSGEMIIHEDLVSGSRNLQLNLGNLKAGTYVLVLRVNGERFVVRVVKV